MASTSAERLPNISRGGLVTTAGIKSLDDLTDNGTNVSGEVVAVASGGAGGGGGGVVGDKRTLLGVGTYLIDTPKDSGLHLRQRFLNFQEQHRGVVLSQNEVLPDIPFRLHPRSETSQTPVSEKALHTVMVDMATSPLFPYMEDLNFGPSPTVSPEPWSTHDVTFLTDHDLSLNPVQSVNSLNLKEISAGELKTCRALDDDVTSRTIKDIKNKVKVTNAAKDKPKTIVEPIARSVSFSERPQRKPVPRRLRDFPRLNLTPHTSVAVDKMMKERSQALATERLPTAPPVTERSNNTLDSARKRSSSVSDLTDIGSIFSWHDKEFERRTTRSMETETDHMGPTSFFQMKKAHSVMDLLKPCSRESYPQTPEVHPFPAKLKMSHLAHKKGSSLRKSCSPDEAERGWRDMIHAQVIDDAEYDRYASRRKPTTPYVKKHPITRPHSPRVSRELKYAHAANGKLYPMFVNVGSQAKKIGRALHSRKQLRPK